MLEHTVQCEGSSECPVGVLILPVNDPVPAVYVCPSCGGRARQQSLRVLDEGAPLAS